MKLFGFIKDNSRFYYEPRFGTPQAYHIEFHFCWYDFWVGMYWDCDRSLYVCPLPMLAIKFTFGERRKRGAR